MATVKALLWFNVINQYRRVFGNFVLPLIVLALSLVVEIFMNEPYSRSELPPDIDEECGHYTYCSVHQQMQLLTLENVTVVSQMYSKDDIQMPPGSTLNAFKLQPYAIDASAILGTGNYACLREALNLTQSISCEHLFDRVIEVPTMMDYGLILIVFYALTLTELRKEKTGKIHKMLSYLGVSRSDYLIAWIVLHLLLSIVWGSICCASYLVNFSQLKSSMLIVWLLVVANNFAVALFALLCSRFVKSVTWFLAFIMQMIVVYVVVFVQSINKDAVVSVKSPLRYLLLLHPVSLARNFQMLLQQAEYSKLGITANSYESLNSYYHDHLIPWRYYGTLQAMVIVLPALCVFYIAAYLIEADFSLVLEKCVNKRIGQVPNTRVSEHVGVNEGPAGEAVVSLENLSKVYRAGISAVHNISLSVGQGEVLALLGKNGAGKSTTMNMIAGFVRPTSGNISVNSFDHVSNLGSMRKQLSFCPQENLFFPRLTLMEHLKFICLLKDTATEFSVCRAKQMLADLNLESKENNKTHQLSGYNLL